MKKETRSNIKGRVARILFNHHRGTLSKYRIAKLAGSRYSWVHTLLKTLEEQRIIQTTRVINFKSLMEWWIRWQPAPEYRDYVVQRPLDLLQNTDMKYALTTYRAENKIQNYLFPTRTDLYVLPSDKQRWHELFSRNGFVGGGNVRVRIADEHVFYKSLEIDGFTLVSVPQVILDLYTDRGVCLEAADMLLKDVTRYVL